MSKKFNKVAANNTVAAVEQPSMADIMAIVQQLKAENDKLKAQNVNLTENVKATVAKSQFVRKSFSQHSKGEYQTALACGGVYNKTTYQVDFDNEASWEKFKKTVTVLRTNSKIMLRDSDLSSIRWLKKSADGETFQVYAYYNSKENYKSSPLLGLITNLFTFKVKPDVSCWHTLPASVFKEFWDNNANIWSYVTGDYDPQSVKASNKVGDDL